MNKRLLAAALCCVMLTGCGGTIPEGSAEQTEPVVTVLPDEFNLGGCAALKLAGGLAKAAACGTDYETAVQETAFSGNSDAAWERLLSGELDAAIGYEPSEETAQKLEEAGITLLEIGTDALVFLAGGTDETISLTQNEILAAYQNNTGAWKGYALAAGTDGRQLFAALLGADMTGVSVQSGEETLTAACPHTAGTLCYTTYLSLLQNGKPEQTGVAEIDGYLPADDGYPLTRKIYIAVSAGQEDDAPAALFVRWLASEEGRDWLDSALQAVQTEPADGLDAS